MILLSLTVLLLLLVVDGDGSGVLLLLLLLVVVVVVVVVTVGSDFHSLVSVSPFLLFFLPSPACGCQRSWKKPPPADQDNYFFDNFTLVCPWMGPGTPKSAIYINNLSFNYTENPGIYSK